MAADLMDIGWWIRSTDEETYGPVTRATVRSWVQKGVITPNTLARHSAALEFKPLADHPNLLDGNTPAGARTAVGDKLESTWPNKAKEQVALAEGVIRCVRHKRPATRVCARCQAPYCEKCKASKKKQHYFCKKCHAGIYNRRGVAFVLDSVLFRVVLGGAAIGLAATLGVAGAVFGLLLLVFEGIGMLLRDAVFKGAGPGKRLLGLRVVQTSDGVTPLKYSQGFLRGIPNFIPLYNLVDLSVPYYDPLERRYGDRWAKTRVVDSEKAWAKARAKAAQKIRQNVGECLPLPAMGREQFARFDG